MARLKSPRQRASVRPRGPLGRMLPALLTTAGVVSGVPSMAQPAPVSAAEETPAVVPFEFRRGHILVPVTINGREQRSFMLDTGYSMTMIGSSLAEILALEPAGQIKIVGIAGQVTSPVYEGAEMALGTARYRPRRVAALPADQSKRREGILGSDFFRRFVVEIDHRTRTVRLHAPSTFRYEGQGERLPLRFKGTTPIVEATVLRRDGSEVRGQFEVDTGCDGALCLGKDFVLEHGLDRELGDTRTGARQGVGGDAPIRSGHLAGLRLGGLLITKPRANYFVEGSPADDGLAGHLGVEILRPYRAILDYSRRQMVLEPYAAKRAK